MQKQIIIKTYKGNHQQAMSLFQSDMSRMSNQGYSPISQTWVPGSYGCGSFLIALLLCFVLIGILVFIYMIIVKPAGTLSVTYEFNQPTNSKLTNSPEEKTCPRCAEQVKYAAKVCKHCGYEFPSSVPDNSSSTSDLSNLLHSAIWNRDLDSVEKLIKDGADLNYSEYGGHSPLELAKLREDKEIINLLLLHGATKEKG